MKQTRSENSSAEQRSGGHTNRMMALTNILVKNAKPEEYRYCISDTVVKGLRLRVSPNGKKRFAVMMRNKAGENKTISLDFYPSMSLKEARDQARQIGVDLKNKGLHKPSKEKFNKFQQTTLMDLLDEAQVKFEVKKLMWRPRNGEQSKPLARSVIENVFAELLASPVECITPEEFSYATLNYSPKRPLKGKTTANGQVSRAISYLRPVLDWAAHRGRKFQKLGAGRPVKLSVVDLGVIHDPGAEDPEITGKRDHTLNEDEIRSIYPLLKYPVPQQLRRQNIPPEKDFGPIALKFILLTLARREEVAAMRWKDVNFETGIWLKTNVKNTKGDGKIREQRLPLPQTTLDLLKTLPGWKQQNRDALVFPNRDGRKLGNWNRLADQVKTASKTDGWNRHDLRRTGATIMADIGVDIHIIDEILGHKNRFANTGVSASAGHYMTAKRIVNCKEDPKVLALKKLSETLDSIAEVTEVAVKQK